jgi:hypothetical protein
MAVELNELFSPDVGMPRDLKTWQMGIDRLAEINTEHHWMLAHDSLIRNVYISHKPLAYSQRSMLIRRMFDWLRLPPLELFVLRAVGTVGALQWWWRAKSAKGLPKNPFRLFVGFGAGPEEPMWRKYQAEDKVPALRLDQTKPATFGALHQPGLLRLLSRVWRKAGTTHRFVVNSDHEWVIVSRPDFLTHACQRIGQYAFFYEWWRGMNAAHIEKAVFISNDTPAFACLDAGFRKVEFRQHGCLRRSTLMPQFPMLQVLTEEEKDYLSKQLPGASFHLARPGVVIEKYNRLLLITSIYDTDELHKGDELQKLKDVFSWAKSQSVEVRIRPHPCEDPVFWRLYFPEAVIDTTDATFEDALSRLRPLFVLSWFSTTLIDALLRGVVPVSVSSTNCKHVQDMIVSLHRHCLGWPEQKDILDDIAAGKAEVAKIVQGLRSAGSQAQI